MILPIVYQQVKQPSDRPTGFHVAVTRTTTHEFTLLAVEHSADTSWPTHEWDLEGVLLVEGLGGMDGMEGMAVQAHFDWTFWGGSRRLAQARREIPKAAGIAPTVYIEAGGHGIHGRWNGGDAEKIEYVPIHMFDEGGLWTRRKELFTQEADGRWMRGGAHAPWSWAGRIGYPGLVAFDPARFILESGVQGWSPVSPHYTLNKFLGIGG